MMEKDECTIPFIARYRKESTKGMDAEKLRQFQNMLEELREVQKKCSHYLKMMQRQVLYSTFNLLHQEEIDACTTTTGRGSFLYPCLPTLDWKGYCAQEFLCTVIFFSSGQNS